VRRAALLLALLAALAAGCSGGGGTNTVTVGPAKVFRLVGIEPASPVEPGRPAKVAFTVEQPSGKPLTKYKTGPGPHTGIHVIIVKDDLSTIIHRHPPIKTNGRVEEPVTFPTPGPYRVLTDIYPQLAGPLRNFQLSYDIHVAGKYKPQPLPPFRPSETVDGYHVVIHGKPKLRAIFPAFMRITVTDPQGKPVVFHPWYGALAHAVFFHQGNLDYFHTHICGPSTPGCTSFLGGAKVTGRSTTPGQLRVGILLPEAGTWRLFLQFQAPDGKIITAPFTLKASS